MAYCIPYSPNIRTRSPAGKNPLGQVNPSYARMLLHGTCLLLCGVISPHPTILLAHRSRLAPGTLTMEEGTCAFLQITLFFHAIWHLMLFGSERGTPSDRKKSAHCSWRA
jgi:hypothetical protein